MFFSKFINNKQCVYHVYTVNFFLFTPRFMCHGIMGSNLSGFCFSSSSSYMLSVPLNYKCLILRFFIIINGWDFPYHSSIFRIFTAINVGQWWTINKWIIYAEMYKNSFNVMLSIKILRKKCLFKTKKWPHWRLFVHKYEKKVCSNIERHLNHECACQPVFPIRRMTLFTSTKLNVCYMIVCGWQNEKYILHKN